MALIPCPECKRDVSDRAAACPHCGLTIAAAAPGVSAPGGAAPGWVATPSGAGREELLWEGGPSPRLLAREIPAIVWAVVVVPLAIVLLPRGLRIIAGLHRDLRITVAEQGGTIRFVVIAVAVGLAVFRLGQIGLRYARLRATKYRVTNQRLTVESGLFSKRVDDVDLRSVEDVALEQSALERLLGVGRLSIVSSDRSRPRLDLLGILSPREVRERVRQGAYQASQRQLFTRAT
jgi:membrane protein YdbS with pleckstrin-like domain